MMYNIMMQDSTSLTRVLSVLPSSGARPPVTMQLSSTGCTLVPYSLAAPAAGVVLCPGSTGSNVYIDSS